MNESQVASLVRRLLDESAEHLPYRVTHRLDAARNTALAHMPARASTGTRTADPLAPGARAADMPRPADRTRSRFTGPPRLGWRIAAILVPIVVLGSGLAGIAMWDSGQRAEDMAELDAAMLADAVPISAYADRGFGVYLKNVSQASEP